MRLDFEVWLRNDDFAITDLVDLPLGAPGAWTDGDVRMLLVELLRAIDRAKHPDADRERPISLRGFNWIVSPFEGRGVLVTVEIQLGAAAAGPFPIAQEQLEAMIVRVLAQSRADAEAAPRIH
jgi:hypothetical protein